MTTRHSVTVLQECIDLQNKKANDYQNPNSSIKQADYYPNGCMSILDIIRAKELRMRSVMEAMIHDPEYSPNFESLEDSAKDLINYASFFVSYMQGKVDGQSYDRDFMNRRVDISIDSIEISLLDIDEQCFYQDSVDMGDMSYSDINLSGKTGKTDAQS